MSIQGLFTSVADLIRKKSLRQSFDVALNAPQYFYLPTCSVPKIDSMLDELDRSKKAILDSALFNEEEKRQIATISDKKEYLIRDWLDCQLLNAGLNPDPIRQQKLADVEARLNAHSKPTPV